MTMGLETQTYAPVDITPPELQPAGIAVSVAEGWAEPAIDPADVRDWPARQAAALVPFEVVDGRPCNPVGRTGRKGRDLGRWGENRAADAAVVAAGPDGLHVLLIRRSDNGLWALPGGMVEPGERPESAAVRELAEETGLGLASVPGRVVYAGYVADHRASDEAWVCTTVVLFRIPQALPVAGTDDAVDARWWRFAGVDRLQDALVRRGERLVPGHVPVLRAVGDLVGGGR